MSACDLSVDLRGLACPMPILSLNKQIMKVKKEGVLEAIINDPKALSSVPAWARVSGNQVITITRGAGTLKFYIKRLR